MVGGAELDAGVRKAGDDLSECRTIAEEDSQMVKASGMARSGRGTRHDVEE